MAIMEGVVSNIITEFARLAVQETWTQATRKEKMLKLFDAVGLKPGRPDSSFDSVYAHALVEYGIERQGPALNFFREPDIYFAFERFFKTGDFAILEREAKSSVDRERIGPGLKIEFYRFIEIFNEKVDLTRTPAGTRMETKIDEILKLVNTSPEEQADEKQLLAEYLTDVVTATSKIDLQGIYSMSGAGRRLIQFPIEEHYTPLKTLLHASIGEDDPMAGLAECRGGERVQLTDLLSCRRRLLIVGDPGGGKTTFLRFIACVLAKDALGREVPERGCLLGLPLDVPPPFPILIRISELSKTLRNTCAEGCGSGIWRVLVQTMERLFGQEKAGILERLLNGGHCTLMLDGLDEEADSRLRNQMVDLADAVLKRWGDNLIVLSSRPFGYHAVASLKKLSTAHIDSFGEDEITEFLTRWAKALFPEEEVRERKAYLPELKAAVLNVPQIRQMAKNPVMLTCLCVVHWNEKELPKGKADLLTAVLRWLLNAKEEKRLARGYSNTFAAECFKGLAFGMTAHQEGKQAAADLFWAAEQLSVPFRDELNIEGDRVRRKGMDFLEAEMIDSGIVEQAGTGELRFWHYTFQEHYAAEALVEMSDEEGPGSWWNAILAHLDDRQWDEVLDHFAGCLARTGRRRLNMLVERVLNTAATEDLAATARAVGILGRILSILEIYEYQPPTRLGWEHAQGIVMAIFSPDGAAQVPVKQRIAAAEALGRAGDPRFTSLNPEMLPVRKIPQVLLGKYPVTVAEYLRFVENGGYEEAALWQVEGWRMKEKGGWKEPKGWEEQKEHSNRPVTGVSRYEAFAFCKWLAGRTGLGFRKVQNGKLPPETRRENTPGAWMIRTRNG